jgi:2-polyprenyl-3-methyl-5-hydroxy-6-metoxy-1,4-benzoquinol methylase
MRLKDQGFEMTEGIFPATAMPDPEWWEALWPRPRDVLAALGIEPGMEVVDLGCGDGLFTAPLSEITRRVVAIDLDPAMVDLARARTSAAGRRTATSSSAMPATSPGSCRSPRISS